LIGPARTTYDQQIAVDHAVRPLREAIREIGKIAREARAGHRKRDLALADIDRLANRVLQEAT